MTAVGANLLTGSTERLADPVLTPEQYDVLMVLLEGSTYSEHLKWNDREYFVDGSGLWVVAWDGGHYQSGNPLERPLP